MRTYTGSYTLWTRSTPGTSSRDHQPAPVASPICLHGGRSGTFLCAQEGKESQVQETLDACALRVQTKFCSMFSKAENEGNLESQRKCMGNALVPCSVSLYQHLLSLSHLPWLGLSCSIQVVPASAAYQSREGWLLQRCLSSLDVNETLHSKVCSPAFPEHAKGAEGGSLKGLRKSWPGGQTSTSRRWGWGEKVADLFSSSFPRGAVSPHGLSGDVLCLARGRQWPAWRSFALCGFPAFPASLSFSPTLAGLGLHSQI